ncbi:MAG: glycoside hydrolase family 5 protein, partial [Clostridiales bacterium]|nr:glycoside hydrolase family 5 protein [Clostridiales bacterium]
MRNRIFNNLIIFLMVLVAVTTSLFCGCNQPTSTDPLEGLSVTPLAADDFLSADGDELKNQNGETVLLNGVNLGGWLHFEGWMDGGGLGYDADGEEIWMNHYAVVTALSDRFGAERTEELLSCYQQNYITEYDLRFIRSLGLNFVRVPFFWTEIMDFEGQIKANAFTQLDWVIEECSKLGMYVLLDLHGAPGGHSNGAVTGGHTDSNEFWTNTTYQQWTIDIWKALANRYKDNPAVYGYDLLNEPMPPDATTPPEADADVPSTTHDIYDMLYDAVREVDDRHIVVLEAFWHCGFLGDPKDSGWENVVYQMHMYHDSDKSERTQLDFANYYINYIKEHK